MKYKIHSSKYFGVKPEDVNPEFIDFDKRMQEGYGYYFSSEKVMAIELWQKNFNEMKEYLKEHKISKLKVFDEIFMGNEYVSNWVQDYNEALRLVIGNSSAKDKYRFIDQRIELIKFLLEIDVGDKHNQLENIRAQAETYYMQGDCEKGEKIFTELIDDHPDYTWGYIGYSDQYWLEDEENKDYDRAMGILKTAFCKDVIDNVDDVIDRMTDLQMANEKENLEKFLEINSKDEIPEGTDEAEIFAQIRETKSILPLAELKYISAHKDEVIHLVLEEMKKYAGNSVKYANENYFFYIYIPMLLGQWEVKGTSKYIIDLVACSDEEIDRTIGDMITECYPVILYKCFDGDTDYLKEMIEKDNISEFSQLAYLHVLSMYYIYDEKNLHKLKDYLERLLMKKPDTATLISDIIQMHHSDELLPIAEKCIASKFYDPSIYGDREGYMFHYHNPIEVKTSEYIANFDLIDELSGWFSYTSKQPVVSGYNELHTKLQKEREKLFPVVKREPKTVKGQHTVVNGPKIGRNEPCPCGSGKKYKYCCLGKPVLD